MGKHLEQTLPSVYTLQCLTGKVDNNNNNNNRPFFPTQYTEKSGLATRDYSVIASSGVRYQDFYFDMLSIRYWGKYRNFDAIFDNF